MGRDDPSGTNRSGGSRSELTTDHEAATLLVPRDLSTGRVMLSPLEHYIRDIRDIRRSGAAVDETSYYGWPTS